MPTVVSLGDYPRQQNLSLVVATKYQLWCDSPHADHNSNDNMFMYCYIGLSANWKGTWSTS